MIFTQSAFAGEAVVIVLETALFKDSDPESKVLQLKRKNQVVWIHDREFGLSPLEPDYETMNDSAQLSELKKIRYDREESRAGFYETMDRNGRTAYIKKSHVKLIYKDNRETLTSVNPFIEDPTDYRLEEPLPDDYPLTDQSKRRAFFHTIFGPAPRQRYRYQGNVASTDRSFRKGLAVGYSCKANWDNYNRFYFGGYGHILVSEVAYTFSTDDVQSSREISYQVALGPFVSYDIYRKERWKIATGLGININWNRNFVKLDSSGEDGATEERLFQGYSVSPRVFSEVHIRDFLLPKLDLVFGLDMQYNLAQSYGPKEGPQQPDLWENENDQTDDPFEVPAGAVMTFIVGIQSNY